MTRREFLGAMPVAASGGGAPRPAVSIESDGFLINGQPTYAGRWFRGVKIEGLLLNARMAQGIFDDLNPETRSRWAYPDTGEWDPERNTREFIAAMPEWRRHGLLSFTINLQGGSPEGYSKAQPWVNSAIDPRGSLRPAYMGRLKRILDRACELGMVPIVGLFYFGQDQHVASEMGVKRAVRNAAEWLLAHDYRNVLLEIANECDISSYDHRVLKPGGIHELIGLAQEVHSGGRRLLVGTSYAGGSVPLSNVVRTSDFLLMHGNGVSDPARIAKMVAEARRVPGYRPMPILFNEDDHFNFDRPSNNMMAALRCYTSWGYFDPGRGDYSDGYQCPPVNYGINTRRKKAFFEFAKEVTGS